MVKFGHHSVSYMVFLVLLFVATDEEKDLSNMVYNSANRYAYYTISLYVFGTYNEIIRETYNILYVIRIGGVVSLKLKIRIFIGDFVKIHSKLD